MAIPELPSPTKGKCDMRVGCTQEVTHIGECGYVYCAEHASQRQGTERCRKMRRWELALIHAGEPLPSYKLGPKPKQATKSLQDSSEAKRRQFAEGRTYWQQYVNLNGYAFKPNRNGLVKLARHLGVSVIRLGRTITAFLEA